LDAGRRSGLGTLGMTRSGVGPARGVDQDDRIKPILGKRDDPARRSEREDQHEHLDDGGGDHGHVVWRARGIPATARGGL